MDKKGPIGHTDTALHNVGFVTQVNERDFRWADSGGRVPIYFILKPVPMSHVAYIFYKVSETTRPI